MPYYYRRRSDGAVLGAKMSASQPPAWLADYATALSIAADGVEEFEAQDDPRPTDAPREPAPAPTPEQADAADGQTLRDFVAANPDPSTWTTAQLRTGLEWLLRVELRRRGLV